MPSDSADAREPKSGSQKPGRMASAINSFYQKCLQHRTLSLSALIALVCISVVTTAYQKWESEPLRFGQHAVLAQTLLKKFTTDQSASARDSRKMSIGAPGYGIALALIATIDQRFEKAISRSSGKSDATSLLLIQIVLALIAIGSVPWIAYRLSGSLDVTFLAFVLTVVGSKFSEMAGLTIAPYVWFPALFLLTISVTLEACIKNRTHLFAAAGLLFGCLCLFEVTALLLVPVFLILSFFVPGDAPQKFTRASTNAGAFLSGFIAVWTIAAVTLSGAYDVEAGVRYVSSEFSQRAAFQSANFAEWLATCLTSIPLVGALAETLFSDQTMTRIGSFGPGSYLSAGSDKIFPQSMQTSQSAFGQLGKLLHEYIVQRPVSYLTTTTAMLARGIWGQADIIGLIGIFFVLPAARYSSVDGKLGQFCIVLVPMTVMFAATTLGTNNYFYATSWLIGLYALSISYVSGRL